ncbi:MAG: bifunctional tRNA (5-methylaminomethyl-2-thiouridine)(34)-methyltransferase MnmD/FAD-dependent 5-carboxymethylaminomethyl-2-thiouridine(34) oxidoreductase MnmC, partial [Gammaproteobacteria bacterium]|nr:bifunctional tRNA (5-methylaminomethyl-2-thiouridine)(34)-methyltransferase MnmD/FAD-dependent 5-carboxymethylaminomethyl-2-thiouridine(34) oxidoreductase MnmC [Gammaproteobacteria bacterium]
ISKNELLGIHKCWPQYSSLSDILLSQYPGNTPGYHQIQFPEVNITLILMIGDITLMLDNMLAKMDAWYLDGFAPSKNPDMWSAEICKKISSLSHIGTTFSTFTAAGFVRRNLQTAGFNVKKTSGFGKKREMLSGEVISPEKNQIIPPWYKLRKNTFSASRKKLTVVIIGGGVAGLSCAMALAKKDIKTVLIESSDKLGSGASGNPAGIVMPRINADLDSVSRFYINCFETAVHSYNLLKNEFSELQWSQNSVLQFESPERLEKISRLSLPDSLLSIVDKNTASFLAGVKLEKDAIYFPQAGVINPSQLCETMALKAGNYLQVIFNKTVDRLEKDDSSWVVIGEDNNEIHRAENVIIANAFDAARLLNTTSLTVRSERGQLSYLPTSDKSKSLKAGLCGDAYIIPPQNSVHVIGATYGDTTPVIKPDDHIKNWQGANSLLVDSLTDAGSISTGRVSFRAVTQDHLPVVGPAVDEAFYNLNYAELHHGKPQKNYADGMYTDGLYITSGHGSRGLVSCIGAANYLASLINGDPILEAAETVALTHPARFMIRSFRKKRVFDKASG